MNPGNHYANSIETVKEAVLKLIDDYFFPDGTKIEIEIRPLPRKRKNATRYEVKIFPSRIRRINLELSD